MTRYYYYYYSVLCQKILGNSFLLMAAPQAPTSVMSQVPTFPATPPPGRGMPRSDFVDIYKQLSFFVQMDVEAIDSETEKLRTKELLQKLRTQLLQPSFQATLANPLPAKTVNTSAFVVRNGKYSNT